MSRLLSHVQGRGRGKVASLNSWNSVAVPNSVAVSAAASCRVSHEPATRPASLPGRAASSASLIPPRMAVVSATITTATARAMEVAVARAIEFQRAPAARVPASGSTSPKFSDNMTPRTLVTASPVVMKAKGIDQ